MGTGGYRTRAAPLDDVWGCLVLFDDDRREGDRPRLPSLGHPGPQSGVEVLVGSHESPTRRGTVFPGVAAVQTNNMKCPGS